MKLEGQPAPDLHPDNGRNECKKALMSSPTGSLPRTIRTEVVGPTNQHVVGARGSYIIPQDRYPLSSAQR
jgi:hypothetical protein